jgi:hypothetical protein
MAEEKPLTPEKELLNLIEKPMNRNSIHAAAIKYHGLSLFSLGALKGRFAFLKNRFKFDFKSGGLSQLDAKALNQVLKLCVLFLVCYFVVNLSLSIVHLRKGVSLKTKIERIPEAKPFQMASLLKSLSYYLEKARERDIFRIGIKSPASGGGTLPKGPSQRIIEATQDLRLVGISWSDDPDVMIEDTKNKRTIFLKKGQMINNEIKLQAVFRDKVVLSYAGEEIDLR